MDVCGCNKEKFLEVCKVFTKADPGCLIWNQGWTQHTVGTSNTRLGPIMQMFLGNIGKVGGGCNILRVTIMFKVRQTWQTYQTYFLVIIR